jgi:predicted dehydrogenase
MAQQKESYYLCRLTLGIWLALGFLRITAWGMKRLLWSILCIVLTASLQAKDLKLGIIGLDTSHATAFTKILNDPDSPKHVKGAKVVGAFKGGSPDIPTSWDRVDRYTKTLVEDYGIKLYPNIEELCKKVDAILLLSVDGRPHLKQAQPVIKAGLPMFIDKPVAGSLKDTVAIFDLAKKHKVPMFTSSSLRFAKSTLAVREGSIGKVTHCETHSPSPLEPHHPDLFWYGIHGVESLFTVMGSECVSVERGNTEDGKIKVEGKWTGKRTGVFREGKGYGGKAIGTKGVSDVGKFDGYAPMVQEILTFFKTGKPPVTPEESIAIYAFMEAADESKRRNGKEVFLKEVLKKARK